MLIYIYFILQDDRKISETAQIKALVYFINEIDTRKKQ